MLVWESPIFDEVVLGMPEGAHELQRLYGGVAAELRQLGAVTVSPWAVGPPVVRAEVIEWGPEVPVDRPDISTVRDRLFDMLRMRASNPRAYEVLLGDYPPRMLGVEP